MSHPLSTFGRRLRTLRGARGLSQVELARRISRHQTTIGPYERDEYAPSIDVVERLAEVLGTTPEYLVFGRSPARSMITVAGQLGGACILRESSEDEVEALSLKDDQIIGFALADDCMAPAYRRGHIVLVMATTEDSPASILGEDAVVELEDGRMLLRQVMPAALPDRFDLAAYNGSSIHAVAVLAVRRVVGTLHHHAVVRQREPLSPDAGSSMSSFTRTVEE